MKNQTNKELLESLIEQLSNFTNEQRDVNKNQELINAEIKGFLESNSKTNQKGIIEQTQLNTREIYDLKTVLKVNQAKKTLLGIVIGSVLTFLAKILF
tara:strand:- start:189 stop:482 length:294 start_codon:yes stop_codon:yes gene_type:complete